MYIHIYPRSRALSSVSEMEADNKQVKKKCKNCHKHSKIYDNYSNLYMDKNEENDKYYLRDHLQNTTTL